MIETKVSGPDVIECKIRRQRILKMLNKVSFSMFRPAQEFFTGSLLAFCVLCLFSLFLCSPTKAHAAGNGCIPTSNPGACDDGTGSTVCTRTQGASARYHLTVKGSNFAPTGACLYTFNPKGTLKGDVVLQSGANGVAPIPIFNAPYNAAGLRATDIGWDTDWEQVGNAYPGSLLAAAGKMQAALDWIDANIRGVGAATPFCAWAGSAGSGAMLYALTQYGEGDSKLDHVQVQAASPFSRLDVRCDPSVGPMATTLCPDVNNVSPNPPPGPRAYLHSNACMSSNVTQQQLNAWQAQSIVSQTEQTSFTKTTLSAFYCQSQPNFTVPGGTYFFGQQNTNINIDVPVDFLNPDGSVYCKANTPCHPYLYCAPLSSSCQGEIAFQDPKVKALEVSDMINNCVSKHAPSRLPNP
jgi:hypothetical protein